MTNGDAKAGRGRPRFRRWGLALIGTVGLIGAVLAAPVVIGGLALGIQTCSYTRIAEATSPDGKYMATLMDPGCGGATSGVVTWALLTPTTRALDRKRDRFAVLEDGTGKIAWRGEELVVSLEEAKLFSFEPNRWGAPVRYDPEPIR